VIQHNLSALKHISPLEKKQAMALRTYYLGSAPKLKFNLNFQFSNKKIFGQLVFPFFMF
jgi:hypothetical protein